MRVATQINKYFCEQLVLSYTFNKINFMKKVKITILKTTLNKNLANEYGVEGLSTCPMMREGEVYYADYAKPEKFCDEA